jgi:hypothetical protein
MNTKLAFLLAAMIALETIVIVNSVEYDCDRNVIWKANCGAGCRGRPRCGTKKRCGNVDDVCYCDCSGLGEFKCRQTRLGMLWNNGAKYPDGTYRFDGEFGDGKDYKC